MAAASRERTLVDLRGLGPALKAQARSRGLTVSDAARLAVASVLEPSRLQPGAKASGELQADRLVKLTVRLRPRVAARLSDSARTCGLSQGAYIATLIDEIPAPPLAIAAALGTSTERLAVVSADLNELIRTLRQGGTAPDSLVDDWLRPLLADLRRHIGLAARLVSELRPAKARP